MATLNFDATTVQPSSYEPLPNGDYNVIAIDSEWQQTKSGNGRFVKMVFQVIDGQYSGRQLFFRFNLENQNQDAARIAREQLSAMCHAVNVLKPNDTCELHNLPLVVHVTIRKNEQTGEFTNEIKGFKPKGSAVAAAAAPASSATDNVPPWKKQ